jgi:hypothetical protein
VISTIDLLRSLALTFSWSLEFVAKVDSKAWGWGHVKGLGLGACPYFEYVLALLRQNQMAIIIAIPLSRKLANGKTSKKSEKLCERKQGRL